MALLVDGWRIPEWVAQRYNHKLQPNGSQVTELEGGRLAVYAFNFSEFAGHDTMLLEGPATAAQGWFPFQPLGRFDDLEAGWTVQYPEKQKYVDYKVNNSRTERALLLLRPEARQVAIVRFEVADWFTFVAADEQRIELALGPRGEEYRPIVKLKSRVTIERKDLVFRDFQEHVNLYGRGETPLPTEAYYQLPLPIDLQNSRDW